MADGTREQDRTRAGQYVRQLAGYRAFIPAPLPPVPPVTLDATLQGLLSEAAIALGRLDGSLQTLPNPDLFVFMYVRKEAVLSSQIEGKQSSLQDVLAAEAAIMTPDTPRDVDEVVNYVSAMNYGLARLDTLPVSVRLIREIHAVLLEGVRGSHLAPGELRTSQNWIGAAGSTLNEAVFVPPPPDVVPEALADLERFLHSEEPMPLLIKIGLAHAQFETIHPFLDGNGRVGRLLIAFLLCERRALLKPVLYLSHFFKRHREEYYSLLQRVRDDGDWEAWLAFFLRGVRDVSHEATETARRILVLREEHRSIITGALERSAANGHRILEYLYEHPIVSVTELSELTGASFRTTNTVVARLAEHGILQEMTGYARNRRFRYEPYIRLFQDDI